MRRKHKVDGNQAEIIDALRRMGAIVWDTSSLGCGFPDFVVYHSKFSLLEVKRPGEKLTPDEVIFFGNLPHDAPAYVVHSPEEAIEKVRGNE